MMEEHVYEKANADFDRRGLKVNENGIWDEPILDSQTAPAENLGSLTDFDPELRHIIAEVHEWEDGLLDDFGPEWI